MKKLELKIDELAVESFDTAERDAGEQGTVRAHYTHYRGGTCIETQCGAQCPSGPVPCEGSYAWTDGMAACLCADFSEPCGLVTELCMA